MAASRYFLLLLLVILATSATAQDEEEEPLTLSALITAVQLGETTEVTCETSLEGLSVIWYVGNTNTSGNRIPANESLQMHAINGTLMIVSTTKNFHGQYLCQTSDGAHKLIAEIHVYEMPTYFTEGMIIVGINAGLVVIFFGCAVYTFFQKRRKKKPEV
ncbi:hypothetical protein BaRGS_00024484 [Batillaria attramentaria]|uniref:Ig-like domain-containing protein n=1 Tax=Batillaria attramentaria TaxID=370345 RepID=A0ABD0KB52_9CAEN